MKLRQPYAADRSASSRAPRPHRRLP